MASLMIVFIGMLLWLISQRRLLPSIVILGAFMFFVLWLVGLIVVSLELWGSAGSVSNSCDLLVFNAAPTGNNIQTLAWLEQRSICEPPLPIERSTPSDKRTLTILVNRSIVASRLRVRINWVHISAVDDHHGDTGLLRRCVNSYSARLALRISHCLLTILYEYYMGGVVG